MTNQLHADTKPTSIFLDPPAGDYLILLVLGISWRFLNLEAKVYWHDEAFTSTVITSRPGEYLSTGIFRNQVVKPADILQYQRFQPGITLRDCLVRQAMVDPQHPPLYYLLLRFWCQIWGTSIVATRSFSAILSLLIFPAIYLLCQELFASVLAGWRWDWLLFHPCNWPMPRKPVSMRSGLA